MGERRRVWCYLKEGEDWSLYWCWWRREADVVSDAGIFLLEGEESRGLLSGSPTRLFLYRISNPIIYY